MMKRVRIYMTFVWVSEVLASALMGAIVGKLLSEVFFPNADAFVLYAGAGIGGQLGPMLAWIVIRIACPRAQHNRSFRNSN